MALRTFKEDPRRARLEAAMKTKSVIRTEKPELGNPKDQKIKPVIKKTEKFDAI